MVMPIATNDCGVTVFKFGLFCEPGYKINAIFIVDDAIALQSQMKVGHYCCFFKQIIHSDMIMVLMSKVNA
jgi:hypothetical protein